MKHRIKRILTGLLVLVAATPIFLPPSPLFGAQQPELAKRDREAIVRLADAAIALPTEYRTDITLEVAGCASRAGDNRRRELLTDLFDQAVYAKYPTKLLRVAASNDTAGGRLASSFRYGLDTLSIQTRIVRMLAPRSPTFARELFSRIRLEFAPVTCESPFVRDVGAYYATLGELYRGAFSGREREEREDYLCLEQHLTGIVSYSQLKPAGRLLVDLPLQPNDRLLLANRYSVALTQLPPSHREFSRREAKLEISKLVHELALKLKSDGSAVSPLITSYRALVERNLTGAVCADGMWSVSSGSRPTTITGDASKTVAFFNRELKPLAGDEVPLLELAEIKPAKLADAARLQPLREPREFFPLFRLLRAARAQPAGDSKDWKIELSNALRRLNDPEWGTRDCPACGFHERAAVYLVLVDLAPVGDSRMEVVRAMLHFLESSPIEQQSPVEWLTQLKLLLGFTQSPSPEDEKKLADAAERGFVPGMLPRGQRRELLAEMLQSRNPVISSYARLEQLCPTPLDVTDRLPPPA